MPKPTKNTSLDIIQKSLTDGSVRLTLEQQKIKTRLVAAFVFWSNNPMLTEKEIIEFVVNEFQISERHAYNDLVAVKRLLGNVELPAKQWFRHVVVAMAKEAFQTAKGKDDAAGMAAAANAITKALQLDKAELDELPWDKIIPPNFEPSPDISVLGFKPDPNIEERRRKMRQKYLQKYDPNEISDCEVV